MKNKVLKKIAFFWLVFHLIAFLSFKLQWTPAIKIEQNKATIKHYILTPKYERSEYISTFNNITTKKENMMFSDCTTCRYFESNYFYPFHKFTYYVNNGYYSFQDEYHERKGFVGVFGYYGDNEFIIYVIIPVVIYLLTFLYRRLFKIK